MQKLIFKSLILGILLFSLQLSANAQTNLIEKKDDSNFAVAGARKTIKIGGKAAFFVVKETAKAGWATTKFAVGEVAAPVAKAIVVKAAPKATLFILKRGTPIAGKLLLTYLKL